MYETPLELGSPDPVGEGQGRAWEPNGTGQGRHPIELQPQIARHVKRSQIILKRDAAILFLVPFQCIEHHIAEPVNEPRLQTDIR